MKLNKAISETDTVHILGSGNFSAEEALMTYEELTEAEQAVYDRTMDAMGTTAAVEAIYRRYFPNYFYFEASE